MTEIWTMGELLAEIMRAETGVPLGRVGSFRGPFPSGAPGIFIDTVARLGHSAGIISGVGDDEFGRQILDRLERDGVRTDLVEVLPGRSTGTAFIAYDDDGSRDYLFHWAATPAVMAPTPPVEVADGARFFHVMGCSLMADDDFAARILETASIFRTAGAAVSFDPNVRPELLTGAAFSDVVDPILRQASILLPSEAELRSLAEFDDLDVAAAMVSERYDIDVIVVKRGERGAVVFADGERADVAAYGIEEVDPTGAGDCFDAGFLSALLDGASPTAAARHGAAVGALGAAAMGPMEGDITPATVAALLDAAVPALRARR